MTPTEAIQDLRKRHRATVIGKAAGVSKGMVWRWQTGGYVPTLAAAILIDEALGAAKLVEVVRAHRTKPCPVCHRDFVPSNTSGLYCSRKCLTEMQREKMRVQRNSTRHNEVIRLSAQLRSVRRISKRQRVALDGICAICPEGPDQCGNGLCPAHGVTRYQCSVEVCAVHRGQQGREGAA